MIVMQNKTRIYLIRKYCKYYYIKLTHLNHAKSKKKIVIRHTRGYEVTSLQFADLFVNNLIQETAKGPLWSSSQIATCYY